MPEHVMARTTNEIVDDIIDWPTTWNNQANDDTVMVILNSYIGQLHNSIHLGRKLSTPTDLIIDRLGNEVIVIYLDHNHYGNDIMRLMNEDTAISLAIPGVDDVVIIATDDEFEMLSPSTKQFILYHEKGHAYHRHFADLLKKPQDEMHEIELDCREYLADLYAAQHVGWVTSYHALRDLQVEFLKCIQDATRVYGKGCGTLRDYLRVCAGDMSGLEQLIRRTEYLREEFDHGRIKA